MRWCARSSGIISKQESPVSTMAGKFQVCVSTAYANLRHSLNIRAGASVWFIARRDESEYNKAVQEGVEYAYNGS